jgi:hypothetical protein
VSTLCSQVTSYAGVTMAGRQVHELQASLSGSVDESLHEVPEINRFLSVQRNASVAQSLKPLFSISVQYNVPPKPKSPSPRMRTAPVDAIARKSTVGDDSANSSLAEVDLLLIGDIGGDNDSDSDCDADHRQLDAILSPTRSDEGWFDELAFDVTPAAVGLSVTSLIHSIVSKLSSIPQVL